MSSLRAPRLIPERLLRRFWIEQSFPALNLQTADGRPLNIILPGTPNRNSGPDFLGARIRIGDILYSGDVELHRGCRDWRDHRHQKDPRYNSVILHVVLESGGLHRAQLTQSGRPIPVLVLGRYLNGARRRGLKHSGRTVQCEEPQPLRCRGLNSSVPSPLIRSWLTTLSEERLELKVRRFGERMKELSRGRCLRAGFDPGVLSAISDHEETPGSGRLADWEQLLYEGIMEALGYENNQAPFLRLARSCTLRILKRNFGAPPAFGTVLRFEAALFKISGFLGRQEISREKDTIHHIRLLRNLWKLSGERYSGELIRSTEWQFFRMRPENFPTLRIAGAARLVSAFIRKNFFAHIVRIVGSSVLTPIQRYIALERLFIVGADGYWTSHYRFGEPASAPIKTLIGKGRAAEVIVNAVVPVSLLYARTFRDRNLEECVFALLEECPPEHPNHITTVISSQLVRKRFALDTARLQQGALQLYNRYCTAGRCGECEVGKIVFRRVLPR
jgi:hypothetical protein